MNILVLNGSPRKKGNTSILIEEILSEIKKENINLKKVNIHEINLKPCRGCLRCNILKECIQKDDDWRWLKEDILLADKIIFASPVYFHHLPGKTKILLDRFRSFLKVNMGPKGLFYETWQRWEKDFLFLFVLANRNLQDAKPLIKLFQFIVKTLGPKNRIIDILVATTLAVKGQVRMNLSQLEWLYNKLNLPKELAKKDFSSNQKLLKRCKAAGKKLLE